MTGQQLKNSILQLAIQGKLVPQDPNDESASTLLQQIRAEKSQLIKDKKLKKEKPLPPITDEEKPFEIPENWEWCRLGEIFNIYSAMRIHQSDWQDSGIPFFRGRELIQLIKTGTVIPDIYISEELYEEKKSKSRLPQKDDILISAVGSIGQSYIVKGDKKFYYKDAYILCLENYSSLSPYYIKYALDSPQTQEAIHYDSLKTTVAQLTIVKANNLLIPLPPLSEQHRIVAKIEELMPLVEKYDKAQSELEALNKALPESLKKSILQEAIQGKLGTNNPDDEPASELLKRIRAEKAQLIKDKKIKKEKPLAPITDEEKPFEIPENWEWCRLGEIASIYGGKRIPAGRQLTEINTGHIYIRVADMKNGSVNLEGLKYITDDIYEQIKKYTINKDDLYITVAGTIGSVGYIPDCLDGANLTENADKIVFKHLNRLFLLHLLNSSFIQKQIKDVTTKVGQPKLALIRIQKLCLPLPPLAEQHRIVEKLNSILPKLNDLK